MKMGSGRDRKRGHSETEERVRTRSHASIYQSGCSAAEEIDMPLVNIHQPCDEIMRRRILRKDKFREHRVRFRYHKIS